MNALALFQSSMSNEQAMQFVHAFMGLYLGAIVVFFAVKAVLYTIPMWQICKRAGITPQIALLCCIPLIGRLLCDYVVAFSTWRVQPIEPMASPYLPPTYPPSYPPVPPANPPSL